MVLNFESVVNTFYIVFLLITILNYTTISFCFILNKGNGGVPISPPPGFAQAPNGAEGGPTGSEGMGGFGGPGFPGDDGSGGGNGPFPPGPGGLGSDGVGGPGFPIGGQHPGGLDLPNTNPQLPPSAIAIPASGPVFTTVQHLTNFLQSFPLSGAGHGALVGLFVSTVTESILFLTKHGMNCGDLLTNRNNYREEAVEKFKLQLSARAKYSVSRGAIVGGLYEMLAPFQYQVLCVSSLLAAAEAISGYYSNETQRYEHAMVRGVNTLCASGAAVSGAKLASAFFVGFLGMTGVFTGGALTALASAGCAISVGKLTTELGQSYLHESKQQMLFEEALGLLFDEEKDSSSSTNDDFLLDEEEDNHSAYVSGSVRLGRINEVSLRKSYYSKSRRLHPDKPGGDQVQFTKLLAAYDLLKKNIGYADEVHEMVRLQRTAGYIGRFKYFLMRRLRGRSSNSSSSASGDDIVTYTPQKLASVVNAAYRGLMCLLLRESGNFFCKRKNLETVYGCYKKQFSEERKRMRRKASKESCRSRSKSGTKTNKKKKGKSSRSSKSSSTQIQIYDEDERLRLVEEQRVKKKNEKKDKKLEEKKVKKRREKNKKKKDDKKKSSSSSSSKPDDDAQGGSGKVKAKFERSLSHPSVSSSSSNSSHSSSEPSGPASNRGGGTGILRINPSSSPSKLINPSSTPATHDQQRFSFGSNDSSSDLRVNAAPLPPRISSGEFQVFAPQSQVHFKRISNYTNGTHGKQSLSLMSYSTATGGSGTTASGSNSGTGTTTFSNHYYTGKTFTNTSNTSSSNSSSNSINYSPQNYTLTGRCFGLTYLHFRDR